MTFQQNADSARVEQRKPLKIDLIVHGRFHAFHLARALTALGHDVRVYTNYPKRIVARFGVPRQNVRSFVLHALLSRLALKLGRGTYVRAEPFVHRWFGRWAAKSIRADADFVHGFSGVMEETLALPRSKLQVRTIVRGSTHIAEQARLLLEEEARAGVAIDRPTAWITAREQREYACADRIVVLSQFARLGFERHGVPSEKVRAISLGVQVESFRSPHEVKLERERRILAGAPLRVLMTGTFSFRKGVLDLVKVAAGVRGVAKVRFVGDCPPETRRQKIEAEGDIEFVPRVSEADLRREYEWADIFIFTTIEDGFAAVLLQAAAAGLPIVATTNSSAPDFVVNDKNGWIVPVRDAQAFIDRIHWCDVHRTELARMCRVVSSTQVELTWQTMAIGMLKVYYDVRCRV
jgi:glycosyltransferase involved in cell wall biosynthesis